MPEDLIEQSAAWAMPSEKQRAEFLNKILASKWFVEDEDEQGKVNLPREILICLRDRREGLSTNQLLKELKLNDKDVKQRAQQRTACKNLHTKIDRYVEENRETIEYSCAYFNTQSSGNRKHRIDVSFPQILSKRENRSSSSESPGTPTETLSEGLAKAFWNAHLEAEGSVDPSSGRQTVNVTMFISAPTFFRYKAEKYVFRYTDLNIKANDADEARKELKKKIGDDADETFCTEIYLLRGEVEARDVLESWFSRYSSEKKPIVVEKKRCVGLEKGKDSFKGISAVLFGHPRTSFLARSVLEHYARDLGFQIVEDGTIRINLSGMPKQALRRLRDGGFYRGNGAKRNLTLEDNLDPDSSEPGSVLAVITRVPNPVGPHEFNPVTLISCDSTTGLESITKMIVSDKSMQKLVTMMGNCSHWPGIFQLLIAVPVRDDTPQGSPNLLAWFPYEPWARC